MPPKTIARNVLPPAWLSFAMSLISTLECRLFRYSDEAEPSELSPLGRGSGIAKALICGACTQSESHPSLSFSRLRAVEERRECDSEQEIHEHRIERRLSRQCHAEHRHKG
jgi:hypothetical protein